MYELREEVPDPQTFVALREAAGMAPRSLTAARRGLPNSVFAVVVYEESTGDPVGMGRLTGDDGTVYQVTDMAVHPDHQGRGLGRRIVTALLDYLDDAPESAYVNLFADVEGFYEQFGFEPTAPESRGMFLRVD